MKPWHSRTDVTDVTSLRRYGSLFCWGVGFVGCAEGSEVEAQDGIEGRAVVVRGQAPDELPPGAAATSAVLSRAKGEDGITYVAGLFSGDIVAGEAVLRSRGGDDVFVARIDSDGSIAWARGIGTRHAERRPRVTYDNGRVRLLATTAASGEVDCGSGPLGTWNSPMFFLCVFDVHGDPLQGGAFPTGSP